MFPYSPLVALCFLATLVVAGPCDIYASGGTPCVAAHSTTRALYSAYTGSLYQLKRGSDGATKDIAPLSAGGVANAAAQDSFCSGTTCLISIVYDQSGRRNHLTKAPPGTASPGPEPDGDFLSAAGGAPVTLNGQKAYGLFISPGSGYRNDATNGIAVGDAAEGIYAVLDGTHYNGGCCFDYGNAEVHNNDPGGGHMETIYFGTGTGFGTGAGPGPWVLADLEDGLFTSPNFQGVTASNPTITERFVTAIVKGQPGNQWAVRGGNAQSGAVSTFYSGVRPKAPGYSPMQKEGAIILGMGGDNSDGSQGTFYEGAMTSGYPSDATESAVQANIVAAKYATTGMTSGPGIAFQVGASVSFRATSACCTTRYIAHSGATANTQVVSSSSPAALKLSASWTVHAGLANSQCVSYESRDTPGSFIRQDGFALLVNKNDNTKLFREEATFCPQAAFNGQGSSIRSWSSPRQWFRHFNSVLYAASNGGTVPVDSTTSFTDDASFAVGPGFA
ncbi:glycoside hydrolase family 54 protein [Mycena vitilis]|nr:glycoside hydrolase family 54 protein [Mycena vitilis]